jgi:hypothetical protein
MKCLTAAALIALLMGVAVFAMIDIYGLPKRQQSCEERGGRVVNAGLTPMWVGKVMIMMPRTKCIF